MPDKQIHLYPWDSLAPTWVYLLALLAGIVGALEEIIPSDNWTTKLIKGLTRLMSSALAAVLTFQFLHATGVPEVWHIPITGVGAHMGTEVLKLLGGVWKRKMGISSSSDAEKSE